MECIERQCTCSWCIPGYIIGAHYDIKYILWEEVYKPPKVKSMNVNPNQNGGGKGGKKLTLITKS